MFNPFHASSPMPPDSPLYVVRQADHQVWNNLKRMEYVLLVEPRQHGKTSLTYRLVSRCADEGASDYVFAYLDMVHLQTKTERGWYGSIGQELQHLLAAFIAGRFLPRLTGSKTWFSFLSELAQLAHSSNRQLVITLDEVGAIPDAWATDFFATIRSVHVHRNNLEYFRHLTFIISGARNPRDMIRDTTISDFFSFPRIPIADLASDQVKNLLGHLCMKEDMDEVADRLCYWTGGHPYLCQRLCGYLAVTGCVPNVESVDAAVNEFSWEITAISRASSMI